MDHPTLAYALLGGLAIALLVSIYTDVRYRLIYNSVTAAIALAAPLFWFATGTFTWPEVGYYLATGFATFALFAVFFALGMMGGGDVKLFAAIALWFPVMQAINFIVNASLLGAVITILFVGVHTIRRAPGKARIPYGVAISLAGLWQAGEHFFNHFG